MCTTKIVIDTNNLHETDVERVLEHTSTYYEEKKN